MEKTFAPRVVRPAIQQEKNPLVNRVAIIEITAVIAGPNIIEAIPCPVGMKNKTPRY